MLFWLNISSKLCGPCISPGMGKERRDQVQKNYWTAKWWSGFHPKVASIQDFKDQYYHL